MKYHYVPHNTLIQLFNQQFQNTENTVLIGNADEPLYAIADDEHPHHRIYFTRDYFSSALHEIAHWCIAGKQRRQREDYGYWYAPDGRSNEQQTAFEQVEVKPQAIEWIFSIAAQHPFQVSADNLDAGLQASESFKHAIYEQACEYLNQQSLPPRAQQFTGALLKYYQPELSLNDLSATQLHPQAL